MSTVLLEKLRQRLQITEGKAEGNGIGLTQVREAVERYGGRLELDAIERQGTTATLIFPRAEKPDWATDSLILNANDSLVILDDDQSIHAAWDTRLKCLRETYPLLEVMHFTQAKDTLSYINGLSHTQKDRLFLLTDYELLNQPYTGLMVIEQLPGIRSLLVTSHDGNMKIQAQAVKLGVKILPKLLASEVSIAISADLVGQSTQKLIFVDDDRSFFEVIQEYVFKGMPVIYYEDPKKFLEELHQYPKDVKIFLDNHFHTWSLLGVEIAQQIYEKGYTQLYLLTGDAFLPGELPDYLNVILKTEIDQIEAAALGHL